jgi:transcriptional regulator with XRE-family HTH domain
VAGTDPALSIAQVVGENLRALRHQAGDSQPEASRRLVERSGLRWSRANIAYLESGGRRESLGLDVIHAIAGAYDVRPSALFAGEGLMRYSSGYTVTREAMRAALDSGRVPSMTPPREGVTDGANDLVAFEADNLLAVRLGIPFDTVRTAARRVWGRSLTQERDHRVAQHSGDESRRSLQARRGRVTRELTRELMPYLPSEKERD